MKSGIGAHNRRHAVLVFFQGVTGNANVAVLNVEV